jgi:DNA-binding beta-propeller fold protein YncE
VLSISGTDILVADTVTVGAPADSVSAVAITPNCKHALVAKAVANKIALLSIDGKNLITAGEVNVGALPEAVAFSPDGQYVYVGNFIDGDLSILKWDGNQLTDAGPRLKLPGHPASMRGGPQ